MAVIHFVFLPTVFILLCSYFSCPFAWTFSNVSVMVTNHLTSLETPAVITVYKTIDQDVTIYKAVRRGTIINNQYLDFTGNGRIDRISTNGLSATLKLAGSVQSQVGIYTVTVTQDEDQIEMGILILNSNASVTPREYSTVVSINESVSLFANEMRRIQENSLRWRKDGDFQSDTCYGVRSCGEDSAQNSTVFECFVAGAYGQQEHAIMNLIVRGCPDGKWGPDCEETCPRCFNGGICSDVTGLCLCPPGFSGTNCEQVHGRNVFGQYGEHKCINETGDDNSDGCRGALICYPDPFGCVCPAGYSGLNCTEECEDGTFGANCNQACHCRENVTCAKDTGVCEDYQCGNGWRGTNCQVENPCDIGIYGDLCIKECSCQDGNCSEVEENCASGCAVPWTGLACDQGGPGRINITYVKVNPGVETNVTCSAVTNPVTRKANLLLNVGGADIPTQDATSTKENRDYIRNSTWIVTLSSDGANAAECSITSLGLRSQLTLEPFKLPRYNGGNPLEVSAVNSTYIKLTWRAWTEGEDEGDGPIVDYKLRYRVPDQTLWSDYIGTGGSLEAEFSNLTPDTEYKFQMRAVRNGEGGAGRFNGVISEKTPCGAPSEKPSLMLASPPSARSAQFSIQIPARDTWNCKTLTVVLLRLTSDGGWVREKLLSTGSTSTDVTDLFPCSSYSFRIRIFTSQMGSLLSDIVTFEAAPEALEMVQNLQVAGQNVPGQLDVTWEAPDTSQNSCPIDSYTVKYHLVRYRECSANAEVSVGMEKVEDTSDVFYLLRNLEANAIYEVKVRANGRINSQERTQTGQTAETAPSAAPRNVELRRTESMSSRFAWDSPACEHRNGAIIEYFYSLSQINENQSKEGFHGGRVLDINDLTPYTEYSFLVLARTSAGSGPFSKPVVYRTAEDVPPKLLRPVSPFANKSVIEVNWKPPNPLHGIIRIYEILYQKSNEDAQVTNVTTEVVGEPPSYILTGLDSAANYTVKVRAYTSVGPGPYSEPLEQITEEGLPGAPANLNISGRALYDLTIEWDIPYKPKGKITKYELQYQAIAKPYLKTLPVEDAIIVTINNPKESNSYKITDLEPSTIYEFQVSAYTSAGQGELASVNGTTALFTELQAVDVNHVSPTRKETTAEIRLPALTQKYATGYRIRIKSLQSMRKRVVSAMENYEENPDDYITAELDKEDYERPFTIGDGNTYGGYFNAPLDKDKKYVMYINTLSKVGGEAHEVSSEPVPLGDDGSGTALIVIPILHIIAVILVFGGVICYKRRNVRKLQKRSSGTETGTTTRSSGTERGQHQSDYEIPIDVRKQKQTEVQYESVINTNESSYYNASFKTDLKGPNTVYEEDIALNNYSEAYSHVIEDFRPTSIEVSEFQNFMTIDDKNLVDLLTKEFMMLPGGNQQPHKRPYKAADFSQALESDHSRVKLNPTEHVADSNFFDANYIKDSKGKLKFIAAQGPQGIYKVSDFWRMIWQKDIKTVVMLEDNSTDRTDICSRYWPEKVNTSDIYDDITVLWKESLTFDTYTIRKMTIIKNNDNICRTVQQVHCHRWANSGVPEDTTDLISTVRKVKLLQEGYSDPVLVHCSDGCGATGTFIAVYCLMDVIKENKTICVYDFVKTMRKDRPDMVQTKMQYLFVYETLREAQLIPDGSRISLDQLKTSEDHSLKERARKEYDMLQRMKQTLKVQDYIDGRAKVNVNKNRFKDIVPGDHFRPILTSKGYWSNSNDYINATVFENYCSRRIVMTQSPMKNTLEDFWRLVYDYECSTIIMLDDIDCTDKTFAQYWPDTKEVTYGAMTITCQDETVAKTPNMRQFLLSQKKKKNSILVQQFVCNIKPKEGQQYDVTKLAEFVALTLNKLSNKTLIHCKNGVGLCAVYAIVISQIESLNLEGACDVFLSAHNLRKKNQHILQSQDEYTLCFQLLRDYYTNEAEYIEVY